MFSTVFKHELLSFLETLSYRFKFDLNPVDFIRNYSDEKIIQIWDNNLKYYYKQCANEDDSFIDKVTHPVIKFLDIKAKITELKESNDPNDKLILKKVWEYINRLNFYSTASITLDTQPEVNKFKKDIENSDDNFSYMSLINKVMGIAKKVGKDVENNATHLQNLLYPLYYLFLNMEFLDEIEDGDEKESIKMLKKTFFSKIEDMKDVEFDEEREKKIEENKSLLKKQMKDGGKIVISGGFESESDTDSDDSDDDDSDDEDDDDDDDDTSTEE